VPSSLWEPYTPEAASPWNLGRVVHLHRRAGFAAPWSVLQEDLKGGPKSAIGRLLDGRLSWATPADFSTTAAELADVADRTGEIARLRAAWFYRMVFGPDPVGERLVLLWHDHFATGFTKVRDVRAMRRQNDLFRTRARGKFADLLNPAARDPALLVYLDAPVNRKGQPNENLARELMELFTLGLGYYTESDVKEAARCLTGWSLDGGRFVERPDRHDDGEKTVLGNKGNWTGTDLVNRLAKHPAVADRVVSKLVKAFFAGEAACPPDAAKELASGLRERNLDVGWAVGTVLRSQLFFADANIRTRILAPAEFVPGAVRALGLFDPAPSSLALADWTTRMGQNLFDPPNVGGWPGGRAWITTRSVIARANFATALVKGVDVGRPGPYDPAAAAKAAGFGRSRADILTYHHRLLLGTEPPHGLADRLSELTNRQRVAALLASPEFQLN
jgi:uncharacterized protein (DUF1800 family)